MKKKIKFSKSENSKLFKSLENELGNEKNGSDLNLLKSIVGKGFDSLVDCDPAQGVHYADSVYVRG